MVSIIDVWRNFETYRSHHHRDCGKHYNLRILRPVVEGVQNLEPILPELRMHFVHKVLGHHNPRVEGSYFPGNFPVDEVILNVSK